MRSCGCSTITRACCTFARLCRRLIVSTSHARRRGEQLPPPLPPPRRQLLARATPTSPPRHGQPPPPPPPCSPPSTPRSPAPLAPTSPESRSAPSVSRMDHELTANIIWNWSTPGWSLYTRDCHCDVNESNTMYLHPSSSACRERTSERAETHATAHGRDGAVARRGTSKSCRPGAR